MKIASLKGNPDLAHRLEAGLRDTRGIRRAEASATTGSVLVQYDESITGPGQVAVRLAALLPGVEVRHVTTRLTAAVTRAADAGGATGVLQGLGDAMGVAGDTLTSPLIVATLTAVALGAGGVLLADQLLVPRWYALLLSGLGTFFVLREAGVPSPPRHQ